MVLLSPCNINYDTKISTPGLEINKGYNIPNSSYSITVTGFLCSLPNPYVDIAVFKNGTNIDTKRFYPGDIYSFDNKGFCMAIIAYDCSVSPEKFYFDIYYNMEVVATNYIEIHIKPYSWYTRDSAVTYITNNLTKLNGAIANWMTPITGLTFVSSTVASVGDDVVIYIFYNDSTAMSTQAIQLTAVQIIALLAGVGVIIIAVGIAYAVYIFVKQGANKLFGVTYTQEEVTKIVLNSLDKIMVNCKTNNPTDGVAYAKCVKSALCGGYDGLSDGLKITGINCTDQQINQKVDTCTTQYNIDGDYNKLDQCLNNIKQTTGNSVLKTVQEAQGCIITFPFCITAGDLLIGGLVLVGGVITIGWLSEQQPIKQAYAYTEKTAGLIEKATTKIKK